MLREQVAQLARRLGDPSLDQAILAEGNTSARQDEETFWVKASGFSMNGISPDGFVRVRFAPIQEALARERIADHEVTEILGAACFEPGETLRPSVETFMHAYLLGLPEVNFVGHTHPTALLSLLCLEGAEAMAGERFFPDEIVCCGPATAFVPYVDPGLPLALAIRESVEAYVERFGEVPKTIWLQNHGLIALGRSPEQVEAATLMSVKAARMRLGMLASGKTMKPLSREQVERIHRRPDEHYRQRLLWQVSQK